MRPIAGKPGDSIKSPTPKIKMNFCNVCSNFPASGPGGIAVCGDSLLVQSAGVVQGVRFGEAPQRVLKQTGNVWLGPGSEGCASVLCADSSELWRVDGGFAASRQGVVDSQGQRLVEMRGETVVLTGGVFNPSARFSWRGPVQAGCVLSEETVILQSGEQALQLNLKQNAVEVLPPAAPWEILRSAGGICFGYADERIWILRGSQRTVLLQAPDLTRFDAFQAGEAVVLAVGRASAFEAYQIVSDNSVKLLATLQNAQIVSACPCPKGLWGYAGVSALFLSAKGELIALRDDSCAFARDSTREKAMLEAAVAEAKRRHGAQKIAEEPFKVSLLAQESNGFPGAILQVLSVKNGVFIRFPPPLTPGFAAGTEEQKAEISGNFVWAPGPVSLRLTPNYAYRPADTYGIEVAAPGFPVANVVLEKYFFCTRAAGSENTVTFRGALNPQFPFACALKNEQWTVSPGEWVRQNDGVLTGSSVQACLEYAASISGCDAKTPRETQEMLRSRNVFQEEPEVVFKGFAGRMAAFVRARAGAKASEMEWELGRVLAEAELVCDALGRDSIRVVQELKGALLLLSSPFDGVAALVLKRLEEIFK